MVTHKVVWQLDLYSTYSSLNQLIIDWSKIAPKDLILLLPIKSVNNAILRRLNISVMEPWNKIGNGYNAERQIIVRKLWEQRTIHANFVIREIVKILMPMLVVMLVPQVQTKIKMLVMVLVVMLVQVSQV